MRVLAFFVLAFALLAAADEVQDCTVNPCATTTPSLSGKLMLPVIVTKTLPATRDQIEAMRAADDLTRQFDDRSTIVYSTAQVHPTVIDRSRPVTPVYVDHVEKPAPEPSPCDCFSTCGQNVTEVEPEPEPCSCACSQPKNETQPEPEETKPEEPAAEPAPSTDVSEDDVNRMKEGRDMAENVLNEIAARQREIDEGVDAIKDSFEENDRDVQEVYDRVKTLGVQRDAKRARMELLEKRIETLEEKLRDAVEVTNSDKYQAAEHAKIEEAEDKDAVIKRLEARIDTLEQALQKQSTKNYRFQSRPDYIDPSDTMLRVNSMVPASITSSKAREQGPYDYHIPKTLLLE